MRQYIIRRLILAIPTLFFVSLIIFGLMRLVPGDILMLKMGATVLAEKWEMDALRRELGLDKPLPLQYLEYVGGLVRGDMGESLWSGQPVTQAVMLRLPVTAELAVLGIVFALLIAIPVGVMSAIRQDTWTDYLLRGVAIAGISIPSFWLATLAIVLPAVFFRWSPPILYSPFFKDPLRNLQQFILPSLILGTALSASTARMTRSMMLEVLRQDYIRTAWAKGLGERTVIVRHALKNALIPVVTILGHQIAFLIGGTVILESIFTLPGMGSYLLDAINVRDYPVVQGITVLVSVWVVLLNLVIDVSYAALDPRIRYS